MNVREMRNEALANRVVKNLESRNMEAYFVKTKEEALKKALELIPEGRTFEIAIFIMVHISSISCTMLATFCSPIRSEIKIKICTSIGFAPLDAN